MPTRKNVAKTNPSLSKTKLLTNRESKARTTRLRGSGWDARAPQPRTIGAKDRPARMTPKQKETNPEPDSPNVPRPNRKDSQSTKMETPKRKGCLLVHACAGSPLTGSKSFESSLCGKNTKEGLDCQGDSIRYKNLLTCKTGLRMVPLFRQFLSVPQRYLRPQKHTEKAGLIR
jgi:hypothetical protein